MFDSPLTETLIRLTIRSERPHNRAILCNGLHDRTKNESTMTMIPATRVAKPTQIVTVRVRIISSPTYNAQFPEKIYELTTKHEVYHNSAF